VQLPAGAEELEGGDDVEVDVVEARVADVVSVFEDDVQPGGILAADLVVPFPIGVGRSDPGGWFGLPCGVPVTPVRLRLADAKVGEDCASALSTVPQRGDLGGGEPPLVAAIAAVVDHEQLEIRGDERCEVEVRPVLALELVRPGLNWWREDEGASGTGVCCAESSSPFELQPAATRARAASAAAISNPVALIHPPSMPDAGGWLLRDRCRCGVGCGLRVGDDGACFLFLGRLFGHGHCCGFFTAAGTL